VANYTPGAKARPTEEDRRLVASGALRQTVVLQYGDEAREEREYDETRRYCLVTGKCDIDLAMIFANGWGVARDYDAATWFLCRLDASTALAEKEGMLAHVERMRTAEEPEELRYCDHATDTMGLLYCPQPTPTEGWPKDRIARVRETLTPEAARALDGLATDLDAFASADADVHAFWALGNVMYTPRKVEEEDRIRNEQVSTLERLAVARAPGCTPAALKAADAALNESYRLARAVPPESPHRDTSEHEAEWTETLRDAQRAWIRYRDAWTAFYLARWKGKAKPEVLKREISCALTLERSAQLDGIHAE
jgi:uncharacterized protein YecT (DUF1311 family)